MKRWGFALLVMNALLFASANVQATGSGTWIPKLGGAVCGAFSLGFGIANFVSATEHRRPGGGSLVVGYVSGGICAVSGLVMLFSPEGQQPTWWWALGGTMLTIGVLSLAATIAANSHSRASDTASAGAVLIATPLLLF